MKACGMLWFWLLPECGAAFTSKLEGMFKDMELSKDIMIQFKQVSARSAHTHKSTDPLLENIDYSLCVTDCLFLNNSHACSYLCSVYTEPEWSKQHRTYCQHPHYGLLAFIHTHGGPFAHRGKYFYAWVLIFVHQRISKDSERQTLFQ